MLGKLGTLFTAGRRRNTRNGLEGATGANAKSASPKDVTSSKAVERECEKGKSQSSQPQPTDACEPGTPQKCQESEPQPSESCFQEPLCCTELSPGSCSPAAAAGPQCPESDSPQLEPGEAQGETFPDATTAAKQLHASLKNSSGREKAEAPPRNPGEDALPGSGHEQEDTARGSRGVPGSPIPERSEEGAGEAVEGVPGVGAAGGSIEHPDPRGQPPEAESGPPGDPLAEARGVVGARGAECAPGERSHSSKVYKLDIYLRKTEGTPGDQPGDATAEPGEGSDPEDMEKRSSGRRSGRRRKSQKSSDSPGADADVAPPDCAARDDPGVFDDPGTPPIAAPEPVLLAEKKGKSARAETVPAASPEPSKPGPHPKAQQPLRGDSDRSRTTPQPPAASPTKRRGRSRVPEAVPPSPVGGPRAPAKESTPKKAPAALEPGPALAKGAAADCGDEGARVVPRELTVKSSSLLPEFKPEHRRGSLPHHFDGRGEGSRSKDLGRSSGGTEASDSSSLKHRNHFGAGRSTVTTKVTL